MKNTITEIDLTSYRYRKRKTQRILPHMEKKLNNKKKKNGYH